MNVIAINGLIGAGKDTVSDYICENYGYHRLSFAEKLKDSVANLFELDREMLEGKTEDSRRAREEELPFWTKELGRPVTPRYILQIYGTDCMRNGFYNNIWVAFVKKKIINNPHVKFIITDARFLNEGKMIKGLGGSVWRVRRGKDPEWVEAAAKVNQLDWKGAPMPYNDDPFMNGTFYVHQSERGMMGFDFDHIIDNDGSIPALYKKIDEIMK